MKTIEEVLDNERVKRKFDAGSGHAKLRKRISNNTEGILECIDEKERERRELFINQVHAFVKTSEMYEWVMQNKIVYGRKKEREQWLYVEGLINRESQRLGKAVGYYA